MDSARRHRGSSQTDAAALAPFKHTLYTSKRREIRRFAELPDCADCYSTRHIKVRNKTRIITDTLLTLLSLFQDLNIKGFTNYTFFFLRDLVLLTFSR